VDFTRRTCSEEGEDCFGIHKVWSVEGQKGHRAVLCRIIGPIHRRIAENTAPFGEEKCALPSWQRTGSHFRPRQGQIGRIGLRTATLSTIFSRFGPVWLFLFLNLKKSLPGQEIASNKDVVVATEAYFADLEKSYFSDGLKKFEHRWVKGYRAKRRLCWEINRHFSKIFIFLLDANYLSDQPPIVMLPWEW